MTAHVAALLALALALSMDAFAAALGQGACERSRPGWGAALRVGGAFGLAQAVMPLVGWSLGLAFASVIRDVDHWIAFALLGLVGGKMIAEGLKAPENDPCAQAPATGGWALFAAAVATSIDAAAAGVTLNLLAVPVLVACAVIGATTLVLSTGGVLLGGVAGERIGRRAEVAGGIVLICLGFKILAEHLFWGG